LRAAKTECDVPFLRFSSFLRPCLLPV
jgi:hypothetical protein